MEEGKGPHGLAVNWYARRGVIRDSVRPAFLALARAQRLLARSK